MAGTTGETSSLLEKDATCGSKTESKRKRHLIDIPLYDEDTGASCVPGWNNSPIVFVLISMVALLANISMLIAQILPFCFAKIGLLQCCLRLYVFLFTGVFILAEIEVPYVAKNISSLNNWFLRGLMYSFIGLIGAEEARSVVEYKAVRGKLKTGMNTKMVSLFIEISSWAMVGVGLVYILMSILRLRRFKDKKREKGNDLEEK